jgi:hypothetical protein
MLREGYKWLERWVFGRTPGKAIDGSAADSGGTLRVTSTGQVMTSITGAKTVQMINQELAEKMYPQRKAAVLAPSKLRPVVAARIGLVDRMGTPTARRVTGIARTGYREDRLTIETEPGFIVPVALLLPTTGTRLPAVIYVDRLPRPSGPADADAEAMVRAGNVVLMVEPRASNVQHREPDAAYASSAHQANMKAHMLGRTLVGMRVDDILRAFDYLKTRAEIDPTRIAIFGKNRGALAALHAAFLEPAIEKVAVEDMLLSYMDAVRSKEHVGILDLVINGVLLDYDLPDLARGISPRPVWVASPRSAQGAVTDLEKRDAVGSPASLAVAQSVYTETAQAAGSKVLERAPGASFTATYGAWLGAH